MRVLLVLAGVGLLTWIWLTLFRGAFWRTDRRLPPGQPADPPHWPSVAIVVPARDEAEMIPLSLPTLLAQRYPGPARVILVDDGSTDGTANLATDLAANPATLAAEPAPSPAAEPGRLPLTVLAPGEPPAGWTGKLWALYTGVAHAGEVDFLLLTDADIAHHPDSLATLVAAAGRDQLDLVSQMARLRVQTGWERLVVPAFVYFFALLFPFRWSNRPGARTAAAAGGCCLVRRVALEQAGGIAAIRSAVIDDVALARVLKRSGARTFLGLADQVRSVRPYPTLASLWQMVTRSAYAQLRNSPALLAGTVLGLVLVFWVPPVTTAVGTVSGDAPVFAAGAGAWLLMAGTYAPMLRYYRQPVAAAPLLPLTATLYLAMTVDSAIQHYRGRGAAWKGRTYPAPASAKPPTP